MEQRKSPHLAWSDSLLVGNPKIDAEHKAIFDLLTHLWGSDPLSRTQALETLVVHLTQHFEGEESSPQFERLSAAEARQHRSEHLRLSQFLFQLRPALALEDGAFAAVLVDFIQDHLIPHIHQHDRLLGEKGSGAH